ncbi:hypothetical protein KAR91_10515 [Candidatus Pacearchaeota archaeon]|nr:hypothetical protein [Candidatus Pacearchaeota archaeon]
MAGNVLNYFDQADASNDNKLVLGGTVETGSGQDFRTVVLNVRMDDISTADTVYIASPVAGTIQSISTVIDGAITTGDAVLTASIAAAAITGGVVTIANAGSAAGDVDSVSPSAANVVAVGDQINVATDGGSTNTVVANISILISLS